MGDRCVLKKEICSVNIQKIWSWTIEGGVFKECHVPYTMDTFYLVFENSLNCLNISNSPYCFRGSQKVVAIVVSNLFPFLNSFYILLNWYVFSIGMKSLLLDVKQAAISLTYFKTTFRTYFANKVVLKRIYTNVIWS